MKFWIIFLGAVLAACAPAQAKTNLFKMDNKNIVNLLQNKKPNDLKAYANLFYANCLAGDPSPGIKQYNQSQCACAAAKMPGALNLSQAQTLFSDKPSDDHNYAYSRFITLAYLPCLQGTVRDIVKDDCQSNLAYKNMMNVKQVCQCVADGQADYVSKYGEYMIPGYGAAGFDWAKGVDDPLSQALKFRGFQIKADYNSSVCIQRESLKW